MPVLSSIRPIRGASRALRFLRRNPRGPAKLAVLTVILAAHLAVTACAASRPVLNSKFLGRIASVFGERKGAESTSSTGLAENDLPAAEEASLVAGIEESSTPSLNEDGEYVFQSGDVVEIKLYYNPELNETATIRPDGRISLQLIDEIAVAGLTPTQLDSTLTARYAGIVQYPDLTVIVREFTRQRIYVGGQVQKPGLYNLTGSLTALQAITQAGGFLDTAAEKKVVILRNQGTPNPAFFTVDLKNDLTTARLRNDVVLRPQDIIFVPKSRIARMNQFVTQYIDELIPAALNLGLVYNLNPELTVK